MEKINLLNVKEKKVIDTNTKIIRQNCIGNSCKIITELINKDKLEKKEEIQLELLKYALFFENWINREE